MTRNSCVEIDLSLATTPANLQLLLRDSLGFPGWYGCSWDAFWDAITALVEMPETLSLIGWTEFITRLPQDAAIMRKCLDDMSTTYPKFASKVIFA